TMTDRLSLAPPHFLAVTKNPSFRRGPQVASRRSNDRPYLVDRWRSNATPPVRDRLEGGANAAFDRAGLAARLSGDRYRQSTTPLPRSRCWRGDLGVDPERPAGSG